MPKKDTKDTTVSIVLLDPQDSAALTLSHAWHYSFDADKATDAERAWVGPFHSRESAEAGAMLGLEAAAAKASEILLGVK
jgi:hypothetical protein